MTSPLKYETIALHYKAMYLKFKKLNPNAKIPAYSCVGDGGLDLTASTLDKEPQSEGYWEYGTGLAVEIPNGCVGLLFPRSSISKTRHSLRNSVGVIDSSYRGEIKLRMTPARTGNDYEVGDRIGQLIIFEIPKLKIIEDEHLTPSIRGQKGFGSTGN